MNALSSFPALAGLLLVALSALFTLFVFPASEPGAVFSFSKDEMITDVKIVRLTPAFGRGSKEVLYEKILAPDLDDIARQHPHSGELGLLATSTEIRRNGDLKRDSSFAWGYWFVLVVLPAALLSLFGAWFISWRIAVRRSTFSTGDEAS